jgi:putative alpha-1,2-mannosidase
MVPNIAQDVDGKYRGRDNKVHEGDGLIIILSLIILSCGTSIVYLIEKKRTADFINTFLRTIRTRRRLPVWELASNETDCMIGYHSVSQ